MREEIIVVIFSLFVQLAGCLILYLFGRMLSNPEQLRTFFGWNRHNRDPAQSAETATSVRTIGLLVMVVAVLSALSLAISAYSTLSRM